MKGGEFKWLGLDRDDVVALAAAVLLAVVGVFAFIALGHYVLDIGSSYALPSSVY